MGRYVIISSDCHAGPNSPEYREFLDPEYRADFDDELENREQLIQKRRAEAGMPASVSFMGDAEFQEEWFGEDEEGNSLHEIGLRGGWDAAQRDRELDRDGVSAEVVFPGPDAALGTMGAPFGAGFNPQVTRSPEHLLAGARAYNRWAATLCQSSPARRAGLIVAPILGDIDLAMQEIERARGDGLTGGIIIPPQWGESESYTSRRYDPVWAQCQELELPVHTHSGPGAHKDYGQGPGWMSIYGYETTWFTARPMWFMILSGVFERFPRLKMSVVEAGSFWAADLLWRMDLIAMKDHGARKMGAEARAHLSLLPSEYFDRNCGIGSSNTRRRELARRYEIGVGNIMWGNDFPHPEGTWPYTRDFLKDRFWDVSQAETERILGLNAAEFYGFDLEALVPVAQRIGPTPEELGQSDASVLSKWRDLEAAGRPWISEVEAVPVPAGS
jgi:predicted TIM-barrel fold metal-dependent hydrolase